MNTTEILKWASIFAPNDQVYEIRLLGGTGKYKSMSGYFKGTDNMLKELIPIINDTKYHGNIQAYFTLNPVKEELHSRAQSEHFVSGASSTQDNEILRRKWVMVDFDPERISGVSSSEEEMQYAHKSAGKVFKFLLSKKFTGLVVAMSGNGWHIQIPCDMPNDGEHKDLVKRFLHALAQLFDNEHVKVDTSVYTAARLCKLYGTEARKGSNTPERPWRESYIAHVEGEIKPNDNSLFEDVANIFTEQVQVKRPMTSTPKTGGVFDLESWLARYGIVYRKKPQSDGVKYELKECPWIDEHSDRKEWDSAVFQNASGTITFNCSHSHCKGRTWQDFRLFYEPDAYSHRQRRLFGYAPQVQPTILPELPDKGKKWLNMSEIEKVDIMSLERVLTGFKPIDERIVGLFFSEVVIISGSNGAGKSSWLNTLILNFIEQDQKVALWSGELRKEILKTWIQMSAAGRNHLLPSHYDTSRFYVPKSIGNRIDSWLDGKLLIRNNEYGNSWAQVLDDMKLLLESGVRIFCLDNLMAMDIDFLGTDDNKRQKELIIQLKGFAKEHKLLIILVAHPRKNLSNTIIRKSDISGSSDLSNAVDDIFIIHRNNDDFRNGAAKFWSKTYVEQFNEFGNIVEIAKDRMMGADGLVGLYYDIASRRFYWNADNPSYEYGWNRNEQVDMFNNNAGDDPFNINNVEENDGTTPF